MEQNTAGGYCPGPIAGMESGYREEFYGDLEATHVNTHQINEDATNFYGRGFVLSLLMQHGSCGPALAFVQRRWEVLMRELDYVGGRDAYIGGALNTAKKEWVDKFGEDERFWFNQLIEGLMHDSLTSFTAQQIFDLSSRLYEPIDPARVAPSSAPERCVATPSDFDLIDHDHTIRKYLNEVRLNAWPLLQGNRTPYPMMTPEIGGAWGLDVPDSEEMDGSLGQEPEVPSNGNPGNSAPATPPGRMIDLDLSDGYSVGGDDSNDDSDYMDDGGDDSDGDKENEMTTSYPGDSRYDSDESNESDELD